MKIHFLCVLEPILFIDWSIFVFVVATWLVQIEKSWLVGPEQSQQQKSVEQNARIALNTAHYGYVLELGRIVKADDARTLLASEDIQEFYLGVQGETQRAQKRWKRRKTWR